MNPSPDNHSRQSDASDYELQRRARALFERACADVDARTQARLAAARRDALHPARHSSRHRLWLPAAGAVVACALALGVVWLRPDSMPAVPAPVPAVSTPAGASADVDAPLDADAEQLEMYQNLDFYQWLARQPGTRAPQSGTQR